MQPAREPGAIEGPLCPAHMLPYLWDDWVVAFGPIQLQPRWAEEAVLLAHQGSSDPYWIFNPLPTLPSSLPRDPYAYLRYSHRSYHSKAVPATREPVGAHAGPLLCIQSSPYLWDGWVVAFCAIQLQPRWAQKAVLLAHQRRQACRLPCHSPRHLGHSCTPLPHLLQQRLR
jgi:hypothetical protein